MSSVATAPAVFPGSGPDEDTGRVLPGVGRKAGREAGLQEKINQMQSSRLGSRRLPTVPSLARILPGGGIQAGAAYSLSNSTTLAMALLTGPSGSGAWCAVIGMPDFSAEAASGFGIELERLILIPHLAGQWLTVTAAMVDVVSVILTKAPEHITPSDAARLRARLRQRGAALIVLGDWPHSEATLSVSDSSWGGLGSGSGHLRTRRLKVTVRGQNGRSRSTVLWLPELQQGPWTDRATKETTGTGQQFIPQEVLA